MQGQVLIVDDHLLMREALRHVLQADGLDRLDEATTGREAISAVTEGSIQIVLLDISLAGDSGLDVLRQIRAIDPTLPVVMHSYKDDPSHLSRSYHLGANGYRVKGQDKNDLLMTVRKAARGKSAWTDEQMASIQSIDALHGIDSDPN